MLRKYLQKFLYSNRIFKKGQISAVTNREWVVKKLALVERSEWQLSCLNEMLKSDCFNLDLFSEWLWTKESVLLSIKRNGKDVHSTEYKTWESCSNQPYKIILLQLLLTIHISYSMCLCGNLFYSRRRWLWTNPNSI